MKAKERELGEHIGNLRYHLDVLKRAQKLKKERLFRIRKQLTDKEKIEIYEKFSQRVDRRLERLEYHLHQILALLPLEIKNHADNIYTSEIKAWEREIGKIKS